MYVFAAPSAKVQNNDESIYRFISDNILPPMAITRMRALHVRISMIPLPSPVSQRYRVFFRANLTQIVTGGVGEQKETSEKKKKHVLVTFGNDDVSIVARAYRQK